MANPSCLLVFLLLGASFYNIVTIGIEDSSFEPVNFVESDLYDEDEVLFRDTRQAPSTSTVECTAELLRKPQRCCPLPTLINSTSVNGCIKAGVYRVYRVIIYNKNYNRNSSVRTDPASLCLVDCIFRYNKWITADNTVDGPKLLSDISTNVAPAWQTAYVNAVGNCSVEAAAAANKGTVTTIVGKKCLVEPTQFMRCLKRTLIVNCPAPLQTDASCTADIAAVEGCNPTLI